MSDPLVEQGWIAPARRGPDQRTVLILLAAAGVLLGGWGLFATGWLDAARGVDDARPVDVEVTADGTITIDGDEVDAEERVRGTVAFVVASATVDAGGSRVRARVEAPESVGPTSIAVRVLQPTAGRGDARLLVTVPAAELTERPAPEPEDLEQLRDLTQPFDEAGRAEASDRRRLARLRGSWGWIALAGIAAFVGAPFLAWHRAARRFGSMRLPGPGRELGVAAPSSLDPVGAAVLVAGAAPPDLGSAFAGQVLDLVDRKQLPMRRSADGAGPATLVGLEHAEEVDEVAVDLLGAVATGTSVRLPDADRDRVTAPTANVDAWRAHVASRASFERLVERAPLRVPRWVGAAAASIAAVALASTPFQVGSGARATTLLVAACTALLAAVAEAWRRDAARWRAVARARRTERAQWLAWRERAVQEGGACSDPRNLPVLVAIGAPVDSMVSATPPASAVGLAAVSGPTIAALRRIVG